MLRVVKFSSNIVAVTATGARVPYTRTESHERRRVWKESSLRDCIVHT